MYYTLNAITTLFANIIQDPLQETVEADRTLMRYAIGLLKPPTGQSEPSILSALGSLHQILDEMICRSVERVNPQRDAVGIPSPDGTGLHTDHDQRTVSLARKFAEYQIEHELQQ